MDLQNPTKCVCHIFPHRAPIDPRNTAKQMPKYTNEPDNLVLGRTRLAGSDTRLATGPLRQATGPPWSGAGVGVGILRGVGDSKKFFKLHVYFMF